jgi:hypothetical protein
MRPRTSQAARRALVSRLDLRRKTPPGWTLVVFFDAACAPCGCVTHRLASVECTSVVWSTSGLWYLLRCLACGRQWVRRIPPGARGGQLKLDASHPQERAARREREEKARHASFWRQAENFARAGRRAVLQARHRRLRP